MSDFARLRLGMVDGQIRIADVTDHRIIAAFLAVPREAYMPEGRRELAYLDTRVPLDGGRSMLDPMTFAKLLQLADPQPTDRVLVVGAGLGYGVAVCAELVARVVGVEVEPALVASAARSFAGRDRITIVAGPLAEGAPGEAPYDLIFCEGAVVEGLSDLSAQLAPGGRIVAPAGRGRPSKATVFRRNGAELAASPSFDAQAPVLPGFEAVEAFALENAR